ncbi:hypothetical protein ACLBSJ_34015, partial [Klebsiella pneumoniae]|uniref:hypothetical protein n=1 Tax=Klebsiella pneumoniae TaxID=573 RepID=UPI0039694FD8
GGRLQCDASGHLPDPQSLDAWLASWGAVGSIEAIGRVHDHSYGEYRALLVGVLRERAEEDGRGNVCTVTD